MALVFVDISIHIANGGLLVGSAIALLAAAVTAQGPLGFFRLCGQRLHLRLTMALSVAIALAPIVPALRPDTGGIIVVEFGAVGLLRVCTLTRTGEATKVVFPGTSVNSSKGDSSVIDAKATVVGSNPSTADNPDAPAGGQKGDRSSSSSSSGAAARWAGRASGAVITSGKQAAAAHRPEVEAQVKRTIRRVGKLAGRLSSKLAPPDDSNG